ncbi:E3 ubiquitin-protein ligase rnf146 [Scyliorhinus canicula]|uniref:E3 ubiquitin-protein ligase rnf146 n=1 Tax=Scyliorhinus canicula TaxID=7830 RepID=UPI0018F6DC3C|nr:E3 ubiquitin-protein ligase rnf146 [Scyliorhinus canicula]XP_038655694.1 E3 ubiquitin-protein ligase rnf146 [Scyliorhinus canicula]XP_038655696.1 E3 ubiquitin-protein ligase rnf146 [Scyliorhinus canicula]XP_038655697.1 E3 ubiquitin-protein ligase rnf146 [Scyliorhinus canicula]XP_038655698.1 E3 ubiquitin-protein ligase rnf146 [Scyliorhinus canicula]XP_038655699.1 E3 ubiquitin-protein ligase rnf146 [Scyliorhinus canicula]XP_038655700.1 E3 ubiquitin-protein ligase rnf146 [Scyliorhinus canicul
MAGCGDVDHASNMIPGGRKLNDSCSNTAPTLTVPECAICLQTCVHPVKLPCKHIFCFLCVKGASWQSRRCALCRQEIPEEFLDKPALLSPEDLKAASRGNGEYAWYYEGTNGWWQYDERTSIELEDAHLKGKKTIEMLIAGYLYVADLENMIQFRRNEHGRRRKMKRDIADIPKKGVAGLRLDCDSSGLTTERENSADGADSAAGAGSGSASISIQPSVSIMRPTVRPATSLLDQPISPLTPSPDANILLVNSLAQLQLSGQNLTRSHRGEGEEQYVATISRVSAVQSAVRMSYDNTESATSSDTEDENTSQPHEPETITSSRQRLVSLNNEMPGEPSPEEGASSSIRAREQQPDGQCTITEV